MAVREEYGSHSGQARDHASRSNQQECFSPELVDQRHAKEGCNQIHSSHGDRLKITRNSAESGVGKDVVKVVENGIDACELIEHADRDGKKDGKAILPRKERLGSLRAFDVN